MIQNLEENIRIFCTYGLEFKYSDGFTHDWCNLIPELQMVYKTSNNSSTGKTPSVLEKGWNLRLPYENLEKDLIDIHTTESSFQIILDKKIHQANNCIQDSLTYEKERWDKGHKPPTSEIGDLALVLT
ncbi:hypothetical protein O181_076580 [Austropuccinia psidii MF-1]|uniref:Uncharacterized protein n=1 Tax=Austropuccinia psidii MF-1 TaxID=1389203 RepID=A0A9Q3F8Z9_9BASI|nr:hypothetical protein [Austropuccinia psidii MF-1]